MVMALEPHASQNPDKIHTDVLLEARQACYKARDAFYACLEMESNKKPTEIASVGLLYPIECKKSRDQFVKQCRPTWVKHFDRQYASKKRLQRLLDDSESRREWPNGGLIRSDQGAWVCGFRYHVGLSSILVAELWGIWYWFQLAWSQGYHSIIIEWDFVEAVQAVQKINSVHPNFNLCQDIWDFLNREWQCKLHQIWREASVCADLLA
ncbi:uncharacterized protein LOC114293376 isoform X1 [Camellia sinensis]|uniref:uncharacterized protein LOC114293376 isoform X1 n=1 Tax=Camellia sinensis TaxID=4442 RepID=UPI0010364F2F|nr:uncharacterized protein LOC114293376 isoform X1 [Camellia sinensis]